jgi:hypothetical protein
MANTKIHKTSLLMLMMMGAKKIFVLHLSKKKHHMTVAGTDLISMLTSAMYTVDPTSCIIVTVMEQLNQMMQLAEECLHDAEEHAHRAEE